MSHAGYHPQTRFNAPDIAQDLATKLYIDNLIANGLIHFKSAVQADQIVNNSTVLVDINDFAVPLDPNVNYWGIIQIYFGSGSTPDILFGWTRPSGTTLSWADVGGASAALTGVSGTKTENGGSGNRLVVYYFKVITTSGGNINLMFAQNLADPSDCTILQGTNITVWREQP